MDGTQADGDGEARKRARGKKSHLEVEVAEIRKARTLNLLAQRAAGGKNAIKSWMVAGNRSAAATASTGAPTSSGGPPVGDGGGAAGAAPSGEKSALGAGAGGKGKQPAVSDSASVAPPRPPPGIFIDEQGNRIRLGREMSVKEMCRVTLRDAIFSLESDRAMAKSALLFQWLGKLK